jgi:hypothetical protein
MIVPKYGYEQYNVASEFVKAKCAHIHVFHDHSNIECRLVVGLWNPKYIPVVTYYNARVLFVK